MPILALPLAAGDKFAHVMCASASILGSLASLSDVTVLLKTKRTVPVAELVPTGRVLQVAQGPLLWTCQCTQTSRLGHHALRVSTLVS